MHKHHNIPKSRGGTDDDWNIRELSPYDHAYEHALDFVLFDKAPQFDCRHEAWRLLPEELREAVRKETGIRTTKKNKEWARSEETKRRIGEKSKGRVHSEETKRKIGEAGKGRPYAPWECTPEISEKKRQSMLGKNVGPRPRVTCPHCGKVGGEGIMSRWHFDNCRVKPK